MHIVSVHFKARLMCFFKGPKMDAETLIGYLSTARVRQGGVSPSDTASARAAVEDPKESRVGSAEVVRDSFNRLWRLWRR